MRLGVNFMYWTNLCVLVWLSLFLDRFYYLGLHHSDMRSRDEWRHHGMVVMWILVWFFLRLGWNFLLGVILFVLVSFYVLVQSTESWYDFSLSWLKFSYWCDFVCLGVTSCLGAINWTLVWFFSVLVEIFVLELFCLSRCHFMSWCN